MTVEADNFPSGSHAARASVCSHAQGYATSRVWFFRRIGQSYCF